MCLEENQAVAYNALQGVTLHNFTTWPHRIGNGSDNKTILGGCITPRRSQGDTVI